MLAETVHQAFRTILRNPLRSFLTVLGVVIGVASVIAMVTVGQGSRAQVAADVAKLGHNLLIVRPGQMRGPQSGGAASKRFEMADAEALEAQIPGLTVAAPTASQQIPAIYGNANHTTGVTGVDGRYLEARGLGLVLGRGFTDAEGRSGGAVCILGQTLRTELYGNADPVGTDLRLKTLSCRVIGVATALGANAFGSDQDDFLLMPIRTYHRRIAGNTEVGGIYVAFADTVSASRVRSDLSQILRERRGLAEDAADDFNIFDMRQIASVMDSTNAVLTGLLSSVAAVSLLVGGIGIMNIMLVSVTERTREIGIRLAIGAQAAQVLRQFLVEAVVLSLIGGAIGVALGLGLGAVGSVILKVPFAPSLLTVVGAFGFSALVGVAFGYFPARRAARLNPIEALRHQ